jgi:hypothetical protein
MRRGRARRCLASASWRRLRRMNGDQSASRYRPGHAPAPAAGKECLRLPGVLSCSCRCAIWQRGNGGIFSVDRSNLLSFHQRRTTARATAARCCPGSRDCCASGAAGRRRDRAAVLPARARLCLQPGQLLVLPQPRRRADRRAGRGQQYLRRPPQLPAAQPDGAPLRDGQELRADKAFHVSPFCEVEGGYRFRFYVDSANARGPHRLRRCRGRAAADRDLRQGAAWSSRPCLAPSCACRC